MDFWFLFMIFGDITLLFIINRLILPYFNLQNTAYQITYLIIGIIFSIGIVITVVISWKTFRYSENELPEDETKTYSRSKAKLLSYIPGAGHLYLKKYHILPFVVCGYLIVFFLIFISASVPMMWCDFFATIISSILLYIMMVSFSYIDADYQCTWLGLPYTNDYDTPRRNYILPFLLAICIPGGIAIIALCLVSLISTLDSSNGLAVITIILLIFWVVISCVGIVLVKKYRKCMCELPNCKYYSTFPMAINIESDAKKWETDFINGRKKWDNVSKHDKKITRIIVISIIGLFVALIFGLILLIHYLK